MDLQLIIQNGLVVTDGQLIEGDVGIADGSVVALSSPGQLGSNAERVVDATGLYVLPGLIDAHVHYDTYGDAFGAAVADDFAAASVSAAHGGITTMVPFVAGSPGETIDSFLGRALQEASRGSVVDFSFHCHLPWAADDYASQVQAAVDLGVTSFKVAMAYIREGVFWDDVRLIELMRAISGAGGVLAIHAEDGAMIHFLEEDEIQNGTYGPETLLKTRPSAAEASSIARAAALAEVTGCRLHIVHLSSMDGLRALLEARASRKVSITTETCPQYLALTEGDGIALGRAAKIAPPLRHARDVESMWRGVNEGDIEFVGSDHSPWLWSDKEQRGSDYVDVPYGAAGIETVLPVVYSEGVLAGRISIERMVELLSEYPARVFDLYPRKGSLLPGADADVVLFDASAEWTITARELHTRSDVSLFEGRPVSGRVVSTFLRGRPLIDGGRLVQGAGAGKFLPRRPQRD